MTEPLNAYEQPASPSNGSDSSSKPSKKSLLWVWFLGGGLAAALIVLLSVASCNAMTIVDRLATHAADNLHEYLGQGHFNDDSWGEGLYDYDYGLGDLTFDQILQQFSVQAGDTTGPEYGTGAYRVGANGIPAGLYYLGGSQTTDGYFYRFDGDDDGTYELEASIVYLGNYFVSLENGDALVYMPGGGETMHAQTNAPLGVTAPYPSGMYRVGIDIPAGTYCVTIDEQGSRTTAQESAVYVYKDLDFDEDSLLEAKYVIAGGRQFVTVTNGQYLELLAAQAVESSEGAASGGSSGGGNGAGNGNGAGAGAGGNAGSGAGGTTTYPGHHYDEHHTSI